MFFSVDTRDNTPNGTYLILDNGSRVLLPVNVTQVPSLLVIDDMTKKNVLVVGHEIYTHFKLVAEPKTEHVLDETPDPVSYQIADGGFVPSDKFSFITTSPDELLANGDAGLKQLHHYSTLDYVHKIATPTDNYTPNTIGNDEKGVDALKQEREDQLHTVQRGY
tara:strand:+ start:1414 stop:1905 length:492 start_codon:yes stop_codon:yes gene_type:complete